MNIKPFIAAMLGLQAVTARATPIQQAEKRAIINVINNARNTVMPPADLPLVVWDYALERDLKNFLPANRTWLFANSRQFKNIVDFNVNFNLMFLMRMSYFKDYHGYNYVFHDTCKSGAGSVLSIFKFRALQKGCFTYDNCESNKFTNFESCMKAPVLHQSGEPCSWAWRYYVPMIRQDLQTIACVRFSHPGPYTPRPDIQKDSFGCYGKLANSTNDIPYKLKL